MNEAGGDGTGLRESDRRAPNCGYREISDNRRFPSGRGKVISIPAI
jgi:hypothetical protein